MLDLVCTRQRPVEPLDQRRDRVRRVQRLVGVHLPRGVGVGGDLPARAVDRLEPRLDALHGLAARERAEGRHERLVAHELPELLGAAAGEGVLDLDRAAELLDVGLTWVEREGEEKRKEREGGKRREERAWVEKDEEGRLFKGEGWRDDLGLARRLAADRDALARRLAILETLDSSISLPRIFTHLRVGPHDAVPAVLEG